MPRLRRRWIITAALSAGAVGFILLFFLLTAGRRELLHPPPTPIIEDRYGTFLTEGQEEYGRLGFWDMPEVLPERMTAALLAVEDRRYFSHFGVDLRALARAVVNNLSGNPVQGASTIAMQVARLQNPAPRRVGNKIRETFTALALTGRYGREEVLRHYMKIVPLGHQIHGFAYASRRYFRKPVEDLSWAEAALLAALPKSPSRNDLFSLGGFRQARRRGYMILELLLRQGILEEDDYQTSLDLMGRMAPPRKETRPLESIHFIQRLLEQPGVYRENYTAPVRSSLDLSLQRRALTHLHDFMARNGEYGAVNAAVVVADRKTGEILAYAGSGDYFDAESSGGINYAYTPRSSGSILKPFLFAYGLHTGAYTSGSILADIPLHWMEPKGQYIVDNFDRKYLGPILYGNALANSRNITAVRVLDRLGPAEAFDLFRDLGFHDGSRGWEHYGFALIIGGLYVTLEDMVRGYGYLASPGEDFTLNWVLPGPEGERAVRDERGILPAGILSEDALRLVTGYLSDPVRRLPSFPRLSALEFPFPVAVKTGTSQGYRDAWTVGYSDSTIIGAWTGRPDNQRMNHLGGSVVAELVHALFLDFQGGDKAGFETVPFPPPRGAVAVTVSPWSGQLAGENTPGARVEYFLRGTEPTEYCQVFQPFSVDSDTGRLAGPDTPTDQVVIRYLPVLPPEYAAWARDEGYLLPQASVMPEGTAEAMVRFPPSGARFILDPAVPLRFQSIALEAVIEPRISEVVWVINGEEYGRASYPYTLRWPLQEGVFQVQVRFPNAHVESAPVTFEVIQ